MKHFGRLALLGALLTLTTLKSGAQEKIIINSPNLKCNDTILVFSPEAASQPSFCSTAGAETGAIGAQNMICRR